MTEDKPKKKSNIIGITVGVIAFLISFYAVKQLFKKDIATELKNVAIEMNKSTPIAIDQYTRLDSASSKGKTNFIYHYTLLDMTKSEVNMDTANKYIRPNIIESVKNSPELQTYRDNNITLDYKYYDKNGAFTMEISVTPELYNK
ncbi:hypothetical protein [Olleya namhaensis]|uniref:Uncharacterized protein n=1 Tax=Olleya namhaensis TaxID=1144750 RepID=A0A1I3KS45_9FLAO|nr:hypothetical protein [Olleya namhaensis]SFI75312.1 hypothetical protein SAMN05443431_10297 [Olleya namhaensis]